MGDDAHSCTMTIMVAYMSGLSTAQEGRYNRAYREKPLDLIMISNSHSTSTHSKYCLRVQL